jgi:type II secretory pathway pseudopilin PulG
VATLIVGIMLVAAMQTVGQSVRGRIAMADAQRGALLAQQLMAEILQTDYLEPDESAVFGPEASETGGTRGAFDDVDDYDGWTASPPQQKDGTPIPNRTDWQRAVTVDWVNASLLTQVLATDTGVKRITVTVSRNGQVVASLVTVRSEAWQQPPYD